MKHVLRSAAAALLLPLLAGAPAAAQQFVVDDAGVLEPGACQVEAWVGQSSSWLHPACRVLPRTELLLGLGRVGRDDPATEWMVESKTNLLERPDGSGVALVAGFGLGHRTIGSTPRMSDAWAFVPVTLPPVGNLQVHVNAGWHYHREEDDHGHGHDHDHDHDHGHHSVTWGLRGDLAVAPRLSVIAELYSEDRVQPEFQAGVRGVAMDERLSIDVTWGGHTARGGGGAGWTLGMAWTPAPWF